MVGISSFAADLHLLRTVNLASEIHEDRPPLASTQHFVFAMAFSPDDRFLALAVGVDHTDTGSKTHISVLETTNFKSVFATNLPLDFVSKLAWSADGEYVLVQSSVGSWLLSPSGQGKSCEVGDSSHQALGFISRDLFAVARNSLSNTTSLKFFNKECVKTGEAITPFAIGSGDAADTAGLVAASRTGEGVEIFQAAPWKKVATVFDSRTGFRVAFFGAGTGFCMGGSSPDGDATMRCWSLGSGQPIQVSAFPAHKAAAFPVASARSASLIAIQYSALTYNPFTEGGTSRFEGWIIWDPVRGQIKGHVPPKTQARPIFREQKHTRLVPDAVALSSAGAVLAVAGNETLELFTVPLSQSP